MKRVRRLGVFVSLVCICCALSGGAHGSAADKKEVQLLSVQRIWDTAPHNAFTDLIRFRSRWYLVCREGEDHISFDGILRVLSSKDGRHWNSMAVLEVPGADLRDGKLSVTPEGILMLIAGARRQTEPHTFETMVWFSDNGGRWRGPTKVADPDYWLWRVTWHKGLCYGIGYSCGARHNIRLYTSRDGREFSTLVSTLYDRDYANETSIVFVENDTAVCLLRRDPEQGLLGISAPPYTDWRWVPLGARIGGPHMLRLPDGRLLAAVRLYDERQRTALCWVDRRQGRLTECLTLPSGGDTSYPGLVWYKDTLWVSYYSSHEGKAAVYLAQVKVPLVQKRPT
ncbi:MAG: exo-alpha-sialidase [candidate division KSB1 bacterium]|nr:exo-alpha-sialidase [candidate division KSB1 bacterium]MDZ7391327.1 exo-alpha-sialidase [candidate division KSB1 bacterium]